MVSFTLHFKLHPVKLLKFCQIVSFVNFFNTYFKLNNMSLKDNLLTIPKLQTACFYHTKSKSYKLLNMTTLKKTLCKVRIFSF